MCVCVSIFPLKYIYICFRLHFHDYYYYYCSVLDDGDVFFDGSGKLISCMHRRRSWKQFIDFLLLLFWLQHSAATHTTLCSENTAALCVPCSCSAVISCVKLANKSLNVCAVHNFRVCVRLCFKAKSTMDGMPAAKFQNDTKNIKWEEESRMEKREGKTRMCPYLVAVAMQ